LGCSHYRRNCRIIAPCCQRIFTCRRCHDEQIEDHKINRYDIQTMVCMFCNTQQPVKQTCENCKKSMASYFCGKCKFFDDDETKGIWHCEKCGLCRAGGQHNFEHCDLCHMCMSLGEHEHTERAFESNCPVCNELLSTSTLEAFRPKPCLHPIHIDCFNELCKRGRYSCSICSKTYSDFPMEPVWQEYREMKKLNPMPSDYANWKVEVLCNDCQKRTESDYHWIGTECTHCKGWNTRITKTMRPS